MSDPTRTLSNPMQVTASVVPLRRTPHDDGPQETQLLFGETFYVYEENAGWAWGQTAFDSYVGFVDVAALATPVEASTHRVASLRTYRYSEPDLKSAPFGLVSMNAKLSITDAPSDRFVKEARGGWVHADHLLPIDARVDDPVAVAETFLGTPYFWGGRESLGLDCSALVQNIFERVGVQTPRDTGPQEKWFGEKTEIIYRPSTPTDELPSGLALRRGDLVFWNGHVAIMLDTETIIHANATDMMVSTHLLEPFIARVLKSSGPVTSIVRPLAMKS